MTLKENDKAPDFSLKNQNGKTVSLKDCAGRQVVLYFYPKDLTPGCTTEACDFNANLAAIRKKGAVVLGVSFDDEKKHQQFIKKHGLEFDLLVDNAKEVAQKYGVYQMKKFMGKEFMGIVRTTFIIDGNGRIKKIFPQVKVDGHVDEVLGVL
ncbi:MAG: thioredoxin-dependent thiol peroxidase [Deltaproteobacteria bacterium]|nr:thioredoxin-dependent thiol peroxidase [Deltaproteobacteria bacterium]